MRKQEKNKLRDMVQNNWPELFQNGRGRVLGNEEDGGTSPEGMAGGDVTAKCKSSAGMADTCRALEASWESPSMLIS